MKITDLRTLLMDARYGGFDIDCLFLLVETDEGIRGVGEATNWPGCRMVQAAIEEMKPFLIGQDPLDIERLWQTLTRRFQYLGIAGVVPTAISGIEMALWDILGKKSGLPVYQLLGGRCRPEVNVYANYWSVGIGPEPGAWAEAALATVKDGYRALKCAPIPFPGSGRVSGSVGWDAMRRGLDRVAAVREAVGDDVELYVEMAGKFDVPTAVRIGRALEKYRIGFIEEPVPPENPEAMAQVRRSVGIPVAAGERLYGRHGFRPFFEAGAIDIAQPDVMRTGGLSEARRIAAQAETYYVPIAPHNAGGPVGTVASLHLCLAIPNLHVLEFRVGDVPWRDEIISPPVRAVHGMMQPPPGAGLGITLDEDAVLRHPPRPPDARTEPDAAALDRRAP